MANTYTPPAISVMQDPLGSGEWRLMATSYFQTTVAGERLLRAEPWPQIKFTGHITRESAESDAQTLRTYLAECASGKRKEPEHTPTRRGWWQD